MRRLLVLLLVVALVPAAVAGCGSSSKPSTTTSGQSSTTSTQPAGEQPKEVRLAKTKFALHAGLAFGAFHHWIYKPYRAGALRAGAPGRTRALVSAGLAGVFAYHEAKRARDAAQGSPTLRRLVAPLTALSATLATLGPRLRSGNFNPQDIDRANNDIAGVSSQSNQMGAPIKERVPATPSG